MNFWEWLGLEYDDAPVPWFQLTGFQRWHWKRTHKPFDWDVDSPDLRLRDSERHVRRVWPDPERIIIVENLDPSIWPHVNPVFTPYSDQNEAEAGDDTVIVDYHQDAPVTPERDDDASESADR